MRSNNIISIVFLILFSVNGSMANNESFLDRLKEQIRQNENLAKSGNNSKQNFAVYYNPSLPNASFEDVVSMMTDELWIKERPEGLFPNIAEYDELLNLYNNQTSNRTDSKVQHYVCVVDIAPAIFGKTNKFEQHSNVPLDYFDKDFDPGTDHYNYEYYYKQQLKAALDGLKDEINDGKLFDINTAHKHYTSVFVINREIKNGLVKTSVVDRHFFDTSDSSLHEPIIELDDLGSILNNFKGFNKIKEYILQFISVFHDEYPTGITCNNAADLLNLSSTIASDLICDLDDLYPEMINDNSLSDPVLMSAQYLDRLHVMYTNLNGAPNTEYIDPEIWESTLHGLLSEYLDLDSPKPTYADWLKTNHPEVDHRYDEYYRQLFYTTNAQYSVSCLEADLKFNAYNLDHVENFLTVVKNIALHSVTNFEDPAEDMAKRFKDILDNAIDSGDYTETDLTKIYDLLKMHHGALEEFYFNPSGVGTLVLGYKATQLAESASKFMLKREGEYNDDGLTYAEVVEDNPNPVQVVYVGSSKNYGNGIGCDEVEHLKAKTPTFNDSNVSIRFGLEKCPNYKEIMGKNSSICSCDGSFIDVLPDYDVGYYEVVHTVIIENPTFHDNCVECKNKYIKEHAFVTKTRILEAELDYKINAAMVTLELAALPFSATLLAAKGSWLLFRGIVFLIEVESVIVGLAGLTDVDSDGSFKAGCKRIFGDARGEKISTWLSVLNVVTAGSDLLTNVVRSRLIKANKDELLETAGAAGYVADVKKFDGIDNVPEETALRSLQHQIETNLKNSDPANVPDGAIDAVKYEMHGLQNLGELQGNQHILKMCVEYRLKHAAAIKNNPSQSFISIDEILLDGLSDPARGRLIDDMNGSKGEGIAKELGDHADMLITEKKAKAYKRVLDNVADACI